MSVVLPGATLGILGGGQLGRMTAMAARSLGYHVHALDPDPSCAARFVVDKLHTAGFDDEAAAVAMAQQCQAVTLEIEQVAEASLRAVERLVPMRPGPDVLAVVRDRVAQRQWLASHGFPTGPFAVVNSVDDLERAVDSLGDKLFVKRGVGGYDGRGQFELRARAEAAEAFASLGGVPCVAEQALSLALEVSVLVARRPSGQSVVYAPAVNHHEKRVLAWSQLPGPLPEPLARRAAEIATEVAEQLGVQGLLVTELFVTQDGKLLVNELAPRPHNSFHGTEVGTATSQFEQLVRAVCDLPLGSAEVLRPSAIVNLLGELWELPGGPRFERALEGEGVRLHLYGKRVARAGRKMGHLSAVGASPEQALARVQSAYERLRG